MLMALMQILNMKKSHLKGEIQGLVSALQEVRTTHTLEMTQVFSLLKLLQGEQLPKMEDCGLMIVYCE
uniref:Discs large MAGUK scaffold protein 1 n=1 Tax=Molossus molossus TaxID=27622 RepID=A0A7J8HYK6_MOLMO|nr:discs large MAGUK scaffold protein 1 [Molossus molossus]